MGKEGSGLLSAFSKINPQVSLFILVVIGVAMPFFSFSVLAADPGHSATRIGAGTFEPGNFSFSGNVTFGDGSSTPALFIQNSSKFVGIGSATPNAKLQVNGTTYLLNVSNGGTHSNILFVQGDTGKVGIGTNLPGSTLELYNATAPTGIEIGSQNYAIVIERPGDVDYVNIRKSDSLSNQLLRIKHSGGMGMFGINNTDPMAMLHINGTGGHMLNISAGSTAVLYVNGTTGRVGIGTAEPSGRLSVFTPNVPFALFVDDYGSVGIGNSTPISALHVSLNDTRNDSIAYLLTLDHTIFPYTSTTTNNTNGSNGTSVAILFRAENDGGNISNISMIVANLTQASSGAESGALAFFTRNAGGQLLERMRIAGNGEVGIGTPSPTEPLHIVDNNVEGLLIQRTSSTTGTFDFAVATTGDLAIGEYNVARRITVQKSTGYFGINSTVPTALLTVKGGNTGPLLNISNGSVPVLYANSSFVGILTENPVRGMLAIFDVSNLRDDHIWLSSAFPNVGYRIGRDPATGFLEFEGYQATYSGFDFSTTTGTALSITNNNYLGLNTTVPTALLTVKGPHSSAILNVSNGTGVVIWANGTSVGIGTDAPKTLLHVAGSAFFGTGTSNPDGAAVNIRNADTSNTRWLSMVRDGVVTHTIQNGAGASNPDMVFTNDNSGDYLFTAGRIGINTSDPQSALHVSGNVNVSTGSLFINTSQKICLDGSVCAKYILYNGTDVVIQG